MPSSSATVVNIMGIEYPIKGDYETAYIQKIALDLDSRIREISSQLLSKSIEKAAVMAALNLEDELFSAEKEKNSIVEEFEIKVKALIEKINHSLAEIN